MIYQSEKVRIRPFTRNDDTDRYRSWFNDPEVTRFNAHGLFPYTPEQAKAFVAALEGDRSRIIWAIEDLTVTVKSQLSEETGKIWFITGDVPPFGVFESRREAMHIGNVSLQSINLLNRSAELAIVLGESRGKGIGRQACRWVVSHAFLKLGLNRVWTGTAKTNIPMQKVCEGLGMTREGVFRQGTFLDGRFVDVYAYGILVEDWWRDKQDAELRLSV